VATSTTLRTRTLVRRIANALKDFAVGQGWQPGEYQILFRVLEDWGRISVFFIVKEFGNLSENEMWVRVWDHLEKSLGSDMGYSVGLSVRNWAQMNQGGMYSIPEGYVDVQELLMDAALAD
jgi:hypothetical protein